MDPAVWEFLKLVFGQIYLEHSRSLSRIEQTQINMYSAVASLHDKVTNLEQADRFQNASLRQQGETLMGFSQEMETLIGRFNTATDEIASDIQGLKQQLQNNPTEAEKASILTRMDTIAGRLEALGADVNNPIPGNTTGNGGGTTTGENAGTTETV